jgi:phosphoglycolate phosphatase
MTSNAYRLVVFDWEGTLADTLGQILHTVLAESKALGFGTFNPLDARQYVNLGLSRVVQKLFPNLSLAQQEQLLQSVQQAMVSRPLEVCLIPGAREFMTQLSQAHIFMAVASNKSQPALQRAILAAGLGHVFAVTRSAGQVPPKPCPQMLQEIMDFCGVNNRQTLMIGDSSLDIEMANAVDVTALGVDFYHQQSQLLLDSGACRVFDNYDEVAIFLNLKEDNQS